MRRQVLAEWGHWPVWPRAPAAGRPGRLGWWVPAAGHSRQTPQALTGSPATTTRPRGPASQQVGWPAARSGACFSGRSRRLAKRPPRAHRRVMRRRCGRWRSDRRVPPPASPEPGAGPGGHRRERPRHPGTKRRCLHQDRSEFVPKRRAACQSVLCLANDPIPRPARPTCPRTAAAKIMWLCRRR